MKNLKLALLATILMLQVTDSLAQQIESRLKIQMTIMHSGKKILTELTSVNTAIARYPEEPARQPVANPKDSTGFKPLQSASIYNTGSLYLTIDTKNITTELLKAFSKRNTSFDGIITIVDSFNKIPTKTIKFTKADLSSYSDQVSSGYYGDSYGAASVTISCKTIAINDVIIEQ